MEEIRYEEAAGIDERILRAVKELGYEMMTPIQAQAIPVMLNGQDIIGQAQTGTGKTAAFGIPVLQIAEPEHGLQCLILCPTRELAIQAAEEIRKLAKYMHGVRVLPIYGGQDISKQIRSLKGNNVQIIVGTPGRVMDHMRRHTLKMEEIKTIVLDEADEMLNMGFREDIETILVGIPQEHQTVLFSATMPKAIMQITNQYQKEDAVTVKIQAKELTIPLVKQYYYEVSRQNKEEVTARLLDYYNPKRTLIFCNTKRMVDELAENLTGRGYFAEGLHGDLSQAQRDRVMAGFRSGTTEILIATDVAARGIDVDDVEAVFNYDTPQDIEYYVHRIGRTGRAGKKGRSFTLVSHREIYKIREIERTCNTKIKARAVPSVADITAAKSEKILQGVLDTMHEKDLTDMIRLIEQRLDEEDCTAIELAAAFLKQQMGEDMKELVIEEPQYKKRSYHSDERGSRGSREGRGDRDGRGYRENRGDRENRGYGEGRRGKSHDALFAERRLKKKQDGELRPKKADKDKKPLREVRAKDLNNKGEIIEPKKPKKRKKKED